MKGKWEVPAWAQVGGQKGCSSPQTGTHTDDGKGYCRDCAEPLTLAGRRLQRLQTLEEKPDRTQEVINEIWHKQALLDVKKSQEVIADAILTLKSLKLYLKEIEEKANVCWRELDSEIEALEQARRK